MDDHELGAGHFLDEIDPLHFLDDTSAPAESEQGKLPDALFEPLEPAAEPELPEVPEKKRSGPPSKLTPELQNKLCGLLRAGNYMQTAARLCGVDPVTIWRWMQRAETQKTGPLRDFYDAVIKAGAYAEAHALLKVRRGDRNWQSSAWYLERRFPGRFGRREYFEIEAKVRNIERLSDAELEELHKQALVVLNSGAKNRYLSAPE